MRFAFMVGLLMALAGGGSSFGAADSSADSPKELALALARKAGRQEKSGEYAQAYIFYAEALALQPDNRKYKGKMELLQTRASEQARPKPRDVAAPEAAPPAPVPDPALLLPDDPFDTLTARELAQARELRSVPHLRAKPGRQDFDLNGEPRALFDKVAAAFGIDTVYDGAYPRAGTSVHFRITGADYREALNDLEIATGAFVVPLSSHVILVAQDTPTNRGNFEQTMTIGIPVPQLLTTQEITELAQVLRQTVLARQTADQNNEAKIAWDTTQSRIVIRDRVSHVLGAMALLDQMFSYRPEVMIELEFLQVNASDMVNYGFVAPNTFSAVALGSILNNIPTAPSGFSSLATFGGGKTLIGIGIAEAQAMFNETNSTSHALYQAQIRSVPGQAATLHVGEKYPVITTGYAGGVAAGQQSQVYQPPPSYTFEDLGLEMKITPFVHGAGEVTLTVDTSFEVLAGAAVNGLPVIDRQSLATQVRLRNGEWAIVGGLMDMTRSKAVTGFWGLAQIPLFGELFKQTSIDKEDSSVLIAIRPHLLSLPPDEVVTQALRMGTELRPYNPL
jgi:Flp pilus assembly secretin CpaC